MWQTSGGWGRIDRDAAVDAMLAYADAGLSTFDMADHCIPFPFSLPISLRTLCPAFARTPSVHVFTLLSCGGMLHYITYIFLSRLDVAY